MRNPLVIPFITFINSALWALFIRALCTVYGWPWIVAPIAFVIIYAITFVVLALVASIPGRYV